MQNRGSRAFAMEGLVASGVGQGAQFLGLAWVRRELRQQLSLTPYPGTLNLRVLPEVREAVFACRHRFLRIADPSSPDCAGFLQRVLLRAHGRAGPPAYLILPEKTLHPDVLEIISSDNLRQALDLRDGDRVEIEEVFV